MTVAKINVWSVFVKLFEIARVDTGKKRQAGIFKSSRESEDRMVENNITFPSNPGLPKTNNNHTRPFIFTAVLFK